MESSAQTHLIRPRTGLLRGLGLRDLYAYRDLAFLFAQRDLRLRYRQTFFGIAWALVQPLAATLVFTLVLGEAVGLSGDGVPYAVFVLAGLILWQFFASGTDAAATALVDERELVTRVWFPRLLAPVGAVLPGLVDMAVSLGALAVLMAVKGVEPGLALLTLPVWVAAAALLALGAGALLGALNVQYRDVKYTLPYLIQLWFFATPVVYASGVAEGAGRWALAANPLCGLIDAWRWSLTGAPAPPREDLLSLLTGLLLLTGGILYFRNREGRFADLI